MAEKTNDPLVMLTKRFADPQSLPEDLTQVTGKEQLSMYMAYDFGAEYYHMPALKRITLEDKTLMMALQGKRAEQFVDSVKGIFMPFSYDTGIQPMQEYAERRKRRFFGRP